MFLFQVVSRSFWRCHMSAWLPVCFTLTPEDIFRFTQTLFFSVMLSAAWFPPCHRGLIFAASFICDCMLDLIVFHLTCVLCGEVWPYRNPKRPLREKKKSPAIITLGRAIVAWKPAFLIYSSLASRSLLLLCVFSSLGLYLAGNW